MPRTKLIIDNDFGGDPDGLFQLAHHLLSPSAEILGVVHSHVMPNDPNWPTHGDSVAKSIADTEAIYDLTGRSVRNFAGLSEHQIQHDSVISDQTLDFLVSAVESSTEELVYACGGPMTQLARLVRANPKNLESLRVLWIGGSEYSGKYPPGGSSFEYNLAADPESVSIVFANPSLQLWHIPRDSYRNCVVSFAELNARLSESTPLAKHLLETISQVKIRTAANGIDIGETYCLGDSPLVLLSVLENPFEPTPGGSESQDLPRRSVGLSGEYGPEVSGRTKVFSRLDTRLMFEDMFAKFGGFNGSL